jgi:hypothetical protein
MFQIEHNVGDVYDFETFLKPQYFKKIENSFEVDEKESNLNENIHS